MKRLCYCIGVISINNMRNEGASDTAENIEIRCTSEGYCFNDV